MGWYYLPIWKKAPVWTPPYENMSLGQKMVSYSVPLYKNDSFLGVVGIDYSYATIDDMIRSLDLESSSSLLVGTEENLIHVNTPEELTRAIDRSADLEVILEQFAIIRRKSSRALPGTAKNILELWNVSTTAWLTLLLFLTKN